jgi:dTMP kinase
MKNLFITFEGIDGSGKDTQLTLLAKVIRDGKVFFGDKYSPLWLTREPTKLTEPGKEISNLLLQKELSKEKAAELFIKDRIEHSKLIKQQLQHSIVLSSRYDISTLTYQVAQGMDFDLLYQQHKYGEEHGALLPDITLVFEVPVEEVLKRLSKRTSQKIEYFEQEELLKKIEQTQKVIIQKLQEKGRKILIINATQPIEDVTNEMIKKINELKEKL